MSKCSNESISSNLKYCWFVIGLRKESYPNQIEFDFLKTFIRKNFSGLRVEEIKLAFDMAIAGKLELGKDGAKCYENFSCEYFGRIMTAYRNWANNEYKIIEQKPEPIAALPAPIQTPEQIIDFWFNEWKESKTRNYLLFSGFLSVYDLIKDKIEFTAELKLSMVTRVKNDIIASCNTAMEEKDMRAKLEKETFIKTICKKLSVSMYFDKLIEIGISS